MDHLQSSQDFVKALKSAVDPPFPDGPCKIDIARQVWDRVSFYVPSKGEVITEWILTKLLKDKGIDGVKALNAQQLNPILDVRYWKLLADITNDANNTKTWLGSILVRIPIAPIVLAFLSLYSENRQQCLSKAVAACLRTMWFPGVQKSTTETLLECVGALLHLVHESDADDDDLAKIACLIIKSYRNSLANSSNKKKICTLFVRQNFPRWLECIACILPCEQLQDSIYNAGLETFFNFDVLRHSHDSKTGSVILNALQTLPELSKDAIAPALPRLFSSFLQAIKKYRSTLFGQESNQIPCAATDELNASGLQFFIICQELLDDIRSTPEAWTARNALLVIVDESNLFSSSMEHAINQISDLAIEALAANDQPSVILPAIECLSTITRINYDLVLSILPRILPQLLRVGNYGGRSTLALSFLDLILDYYTKTRTIPTYVSNLLDMVQCTASDGCDDPSEVYNSRSGSVLFAPAHLVRLAKKIQLSVTARQIVPLAKTMVDRLEAAWEGLENADSHPDILAIRLSLWACLASAVLSSLPIRSLPEEERASLVTVVDSARNSFVSKVVSKLGKKRRGHDSYLVWGWQICAAAALRMGYVLDVSKNLVLGLHRHPECNGKLFRKLADLAGNEDVLPELSLEVFRYLFSRSSIRDPAETRATMEQALVFLEQRLSYEGSKWSGYPHQLVFGEKGRADSALALLHMLIERWLPTVDSFCTAEQLRRFVTLLMSIPFSDVPSLKDSEIRPFDVLVMALRSAEFWELANIRPVLLSYLTDSTVLLDHPPNAQQAFKILSIYRLILYFPVSYFTKFSRAELVKRALSTDMLLRSTACDLEVCRLLMVLRVFLKRVFAYTGHVEPSTFGLAAVVEHLMNSELVEFTDQEVFVDVTLDLIGMYFRELSRSAQRGSTNIISVLDSLKTWVMSGTKMGARGVARIIDELVTEFSFTAFPNEIRAPMRRAHTELVAFVLPRMSDLVNRQITQDVIRSQVVLMTLWTSLLSFGKWLTQGDEVQFFGCRLASKIMATGKDDISPPLDEARVMTLAMIFQEVQCLPEDEQAGHLEQVIAVYVLFALVLDETGRERLNIYMSRACKNMTSSNYAHILNLVSEALSNHEAYAPGYFARMVYLATRLLKDYPQSTFKHTQTFAAQCIATFASHETFVNGPIELRVRVLDYVVQLTSERPEALRSSDLSGIWQLLSEFLASSRLHDQETHTTIFHRIVTIIGALVRLRRDLITWTLPHLGMTLRQLILCMRGCRPMLGAKQTAMVMDSQPRWINAKQTLGIDEAKALSRLLETLGTKTVIRTHVHGERQKAESLVKPFSKHAIYVIKAYIECMDDPLWVLSGEVRKELQPGLFVLCGMVSEHGRDAVMVSGLEGGGKTVMKTLWKEYEKQRSENIFSQSETSENGSRQINASNKCLNSACPI
ncbi:hypothetical protein APHAL10511_006559 [Amanita phalloides]|nr:hypothetical protein APHAL10511_006559 [Amanita phalloides]